MKDALDSPYENDPRNTTYWTPKGSVLRTWPISPTEVLVTDVVTNAQWKFTNAELSLKIKDGELTEIDFAQALTLPIGGRGKIQKFVPPDVIEDWEDSPKLAPSSLAGKYRVKSSNSPAGTGETPTAHAAQDTGMAAPASPVAPRDAEDPRTNTLPSLPAAPIRKYVVKRS